MDMILTELKKLDPQVKAYIDNAIDEALNDPDRGLELTEYAKRRLHAALKNRAKRTPLSALLKKYGA
ncbi:MAG: hypothetical protein Q7R54_02045 [bacterium]|nr:hypothetical protein [bacterium]